MPLKTIFLNPPSFENFDGGASSRWPATREIESYWYPVWLAYPAECWKVFAFSTRRYDVTARETIEICKQYESRRCLRGLPAGRAIKVGGSHQGCETVDSNCICRTAGDHVAGSRLK